MTWRAIAGALEPTCRRRPPRNAVIDHDRARKLALALPGAVERDHHGRPSFRIADSIFATLWDERTMNVMLDEDGIRTVVQRHPNVCREVWWAGRLRATAVNLQHANEHLLTALLTDAHESKAAGKRLRH